MLGCLSQDSSRNCPHLQELQCKKPSVRTRGFTLALISTYAVGPSGTPPAGCSQPRRKSSVTVWGKKKKKKDSNTHPGLKSYLGAGLQPLVHLIDSVLWLYHIGCVSPIERSERRRIEGVMWCAGHLACLSKIKPNRVSVTSMQSTWAVFSPLQSSRTHTLAHTRARAYTHSHTRTHTRRQAGRLSTVAGNCRGSL